MPNNKRAAQFMPFDALRGYKEEITRIKQITVDKKELSEDSLQELDKIAHMLQPGMMCEVIHYNKSIKQYVLTRGMLAEINPMYKYVQIVKTKIYFDDIYSIKSPDINDCF